MLEGEEKLDIKADKSRIELDRNAVAVYKLRCLAAAPIGRAGTEQERGRPTSDEEGHGSIQQIELFDIAKIDLEMGAGRIV